MIVKNIVLSIIFALLAAIFAKKKVKINQNNGSRRIRILGDLNP
jgi:hypothetical protein